MMIPLEKAKMQIRSLVTCVCVCVCALLWQSHETILWFRL